METKWNAMAQKRNELAQKKDELENERDEMAKQRDEIVEQRDELAKERDELAKGRDKVTNERDEMAKELDKLKKERSQMGKKCEAALAHAEMLDSMVPTLEAMRSEMKRLLLQSKSALLEAGVPKRQKTDESVPYWYGEHSWAGREDIPWNEGEKRAMTPSEGIQWLSLELQTAKNGAPSKKRSSTSRAQVDNHYGLLASSPGR
jgi:seryl-tRNA synthetase